MNNKKKLTFKFKEFPFNLMKIDPNLTNIKPSEKYGDLHVNFCILQNGEYFKFNIDFGVGIQSFSLTYYISDKDKEGKHPLIYFHPILHPKWQETNSKGEQLFIESQTGNDIEKFFNEMRKTIEKLLNDLDFKLKQKILGDNARKTQDFIDDIVQFPLDKKTNIRDEKQSKTFGIKIFIVDSKDQSKKYNQTIKNDHIKIPDTSYKIFTEFYNISESPETDRERILDYNLIKPFIYSPNSHIYSNASNIRKNLLLNIIMNSPVLHTKGKEANLQITAQEIRILGQNSKGGNKEISKSKEIELLKLKQQAKIEYGFIEDGEVDEDIDKFDYVNYNINNENENENNEQNKELIETLEKEFNTQINNDESLKRKLENDDNNNENDHLKKKLKTNDNIQINKDESLKRKLPNNFKENVNDNNHLKKRFKKTTTHHKKIFDNDQFHSQLPL